MKRIWLLVMVVSVLLSFNVFSKEDTKVKEKIIDATLRDRAGETDGSCDKITDDKLVPVKPIDEEKDEEESQKATATKK